jgi:hypothetical protein
VGGDEEGGVKSAFGLSLGLICVIVFKSVVATQAATPAPVGVDGIMRVLTDQKRWTLYRDRADRVKDPADRSLGRQHLIVQYQPRLSSCASVHV